MFVLWNFTPQLMNWFGREQYVALYLSSGVWASFLSKSIKMISRNTNPSIGAVSSTILNHLMQISNFKSHLNVQSGALLGIVAFHCLLFPESQIGLIIIPFVTVKATYALYGLMTVDAAGVLMRWKFLDHASHLGGALFGM